MQDAMIWPAQLALWRSETETKQLELKQKNRSSEGQKVKKKVEFWRLDILMKPMSLAKHLLDTESIELNKCSDWSIHVKLPYHNKK